MIMGGGFKCSDPNDNRCLNMKAISIIICSRNGFLKKMEDKMKKKQYI